MHGKPEEVKQMMLERLEVMETLDKQAWHARVQEIVELQCPCPDEWFDELDAELRERGW